MTPIRLLIFVLALALAASSRADLPATIERVKPAVIIVGKYRETDNPRFSLGGAGFVVGDGHLAVTNAHVLERLPRRVRPEGDGALHRARHGLRRPVPVHRRRDGAR